MLGRSPASSRIEPANNAGFNRDPYEVLWPLTAASLRGGQIGALAVSCVSLSSQIDMHRGYALLDARQQDLELLQTRQSQGGGAVSELLQTRQSQGGGAVS